MAALFKEEYMVLLRNYDQMKQVVSEAQDQLNKFMNSTHVTETLFAQQKIVEYYARNKKPDVIQNWEFLADDDTRVT